MRWIMHIEMPWPMRFLFGLMCGDPLPGKPHTLSEYFKPLD